MNAALQYPEERQIKEVFFLPQEKLPDIAESKKSILDVLCRDRRGFEYIIEVQNKHLQNYIQRAQYYVSRLYFSQLKAGDDYHSLRPVTMLSIMTGNIFPHTVGHLSHHHFLEKETKYQYLNDLNFTFIELPKFQKEQKE